MSTRQNPAVASACAALLLWCGNIDLTVGQEQTSPDASSNRLKASSAIPAHLEAGEFGLAREIAGQTGIERDQWLGQIAEAQARTGARGGAVRSLADIGDDRYRSETAGRLNSVAGGAPGGGSQADFDTLINLIEATIAPDSWETLGGPGAMDGFPQGVFVDAEGVLRKLAGESRPGDDRALSHIHRASRHASKSAGDARHESALRKVSLPRLEKEIQARWALGQSPDQAMASLAGLREIKYVLVYPDTGDLVLAGPAGDWTVDAEGRQVSVFDGKPILQLDDLVVLMRSALHGDGRFGCSISPKQEHLARTQEYLAETSQRPLRAGTRTRWLSGLREALGNQDVSVYGVDPRTRVARVIVEADYHMKLVGMGLEPGVLGVTSYLNLIEVEPGQAPPPLDVLRWWFTLNYDAIATNSAHKAFQLRGQGVQVLSENQLLTQQGQQIPTGKSDALNHQFAHSFTEHFAELAEKYPVYAQLKNIFDLALVGALMRQEDLHTQVGWQLAHFLEPDKYHVALERVPREVPSVVNHRVINRKHVIAGVSGGITADPQSFVRPASIQVVTQSTEFDADYQRSSPDTRWQVGGSWWWD